MHRSHLRPAAVALGVLSLLGPAGCTPAGGPARTAANISITYLQKQGDQQYFREEAAGARARAERLGVELVVADLGDDARQTLAEVRAAAERRTGGLIVAVPDPAVGPDLVALAAQAKVPLLASDDQICATNAVPAACGQDDLVPRIGFSGRQMGAEVGRRAAEEFGKAGWDRADTRILAAWKHDVTVCTDRVNAADEAFLSTAGASIRRIHVETDNTVAGARERVAVAVRANPKVKHWVVWGCNDENVQGGVTALANAGFGAEDVIGVGLGAYLACKDWNGGEPSGMKAALFIDGRGVGALAVQTMYDRLKNGKDFPKEAFAPTTMVDPGSWKAAGLSCG
ncbi:substrate-binding domain-containing protein [Kitasatospora terrestris]|uniref:Substrate-binding domain-containing protein n=1 Tax=Kitasatospora terrestris TaxID=258051 RepID=A0ABP9DAK5_9ACTN